MSDSLAKFVSSSSGQRVNVLGLDLRVILSAEDTAGQLELVELNGAPGLGIPPHVHTREDEIFTILEGQAEFVIDGEVQIVGPGDTIYGVKNAPHGFKVIGEQNLRMLFSVRPASLGPMFDELAEVKDPTDSSVPEICEKYGIRFV